MISRESLQKDVSLREYVTFKLGGSADFFYEAKTGDELAEAVKYAITEGMPWFVLGGGSNLVVSDQGVSGLVIRNLSSDVEAVDDNARITLSSGFKLAHLVELAAAHSLTGAEDFAGIPGSIGGAVCGNAGAYGRSISDILVSAEIMFPDGLIKKLHSDFFQYEYRDSKLKKEPGYTVLSAEFQLAPGNKTEIDAKIEKIIAERAGKHPAKDIGCAGSFFRNLPPADGETRRTAAGAVLEQAGAKQMSVGGASVYEKHANFIINKGSATAADVKELAKQLKLKVKEQFGVELHEEVLYIGR